MKKKNKNVTTAKPRQAKTIKKATRTEGGPRNNRLLQSARAEIAERLARPEGAEAAAQAPATASPDQDRQTGDSAPTRAPRGRGAIRNQPRRLSALTAAAQILSETRQALRAQQLIDIMAERGLWASPKGKTPEATLYAAIAREIAHKGERSRFARGERGFFVARD